MSISDDITQAESSGDPMAKAKTSSATGLGQFVNATWLEMIKRYRPDLAQGKSDAEILELRKDPDRSREMTKKYAEENEAKLRQAGLPVTPGSTYLMHFAGPSGAIKLMRADPDAPVESILGGDAIKANPHLQGKTAGWVIGWANKKIAEANRMITRAPASKPWPPLDAHPVPYLAQTQALDPAFGATQWLQRPTSPNVLQPATAPPFAPSAGAPEHAATQYLDETRRAQQMLGNLPHAPSAVPQPAAPTSPLQNGGPKPPQRGPTAPSARSPQLEASRPGIGPPLDITPQLAPRMSIPGAAGPAPVTDGLPPLHFAPETPRSFGPFEVPGLFGRMFSVARVLHPPQAERRPIH